MTRASLVLCAALIGGIGPATADEPVRALVEKRVKALAPQVVTWRRHIHQHPELSNREVRTAAYVVERLRAIGVESIKTGVARHGVVALIKGKHPGKVVALRGDMDALPVTEATGLPFASKNKGVMHACGHDIHTSVLLGAGAVLAGMRDQLHGTVKLIFQPAEEGPPEGEEGGAKLMVEEGVLTDPKPDAIFALHAFPDLKSGQLGYAMGGMFASVDQFKVEIIGKQTHAAFPWGGVDPVVASAHVITALQTISSRIVDARRPVVVSVGVIKGGERWNIIPGRVVLEGTVRTHDKLVRDQARKAFHRIVKDTAAAHGAKVTISYQDMAPVTWNDPSLGKRMLPTLARAVGAKNVVKLLPAMGGEDFAFFALKVPGFYIRLGVTNEKLAPAKPLHTPKFFVDEAAIPVGMRVMSLFALDYLSPPALRTR